MSDTPFDLTRFAVERSLAAVAEFFPDEDRQPANRQPGAGDETGKAEAGEGEGSAAFSGSPHEPCEISFTPVPRKRARKRGWSAERQRAFIFALSRCGSVSAAARAVGMSPRSAYALLEAEGADDFARAWDQASDEGLERMRSDSFSRALGGVFVPVWRRGKIVRVEHRQSDALAIALLSGRDKSVDDYGRNAAQRRRRLKADFAECDRLRELERQRVEQVEREHQAIRDRIELERLLRPRAQPRVRAL